MNSVDKVFRELGQLYEMNQAIKKFAMPQSPPRRHKEKQVRQRAPHTEPQTQMPLPRNAGLTLIEVMLALVILGTGLVALVTAAGRCISVARQAKNFETARELLARVEVEKPMQLEEKPEDIAGSGSFGSEFPGFRWERSIEKEGFEEDGLWRVTTQILWAEDKTARREEVVTLLYWPEDRAGGSFERTR